MPGMPQHGHQQYPAPGMPHQPYPAPGMYPTQPGMGYPLLDFLSVNDLEDSYGQEWVKKKIPSN
jgi:hypothetical protein